MSYDTVPIRWEPPEGPDDRKEVWSRVILEVIEDYPEADVVVTKEGTGSWAIRAIVSLPEARVLTELTHAIVDALKRVGLPAKSAF